MFSPYSNCVIIVITQCAFVKLSILWVWFENKTRLPRNLRPELKIEMEGIFVILTARSGVQRTRA